MQRTFRYNIVSGKRYEINDKFNSFVEEASESALQSGRIEVDGKALRKAFTYQLSDSPDNVAAIELMEYGEAKPWSMSYDEDYKGTSCGLKVKGKNIFLSEVAWILENDEVRNFIKQKMPELSLEEIEAAQRILTGLVIGFECSVYPKSPDRGSTQPTEYLIRAALSDELKRIHGIVSRTILEIYPHYYPSGAVEYFQSHHRLEHIAADIAEGCVFAAEADGTIVGTVTVRENKILRLFVLPEYQGRGIGSALLDFAEHKIVLRHSAVSLAASLPAKKFYLSHGYRDMEFHKIAAPNGDILCYDTMSKQVFQTIPWC